MAPAALDPRHVRALTALLGAGVGGGVGAYEAAQQSDVTRKGVLGNALVNALAGAASYSGIPRNVGRSRQLVQMLGGRAAAPHMVMEGLFGTARAALPIYSSVAGAQLASPAGRQRISDVLQGTREAGAIAGSSPELRTEALTRIARKAVGPSVESAAGSLGRWMTIQGLLGAATGLPAAALAHMLIRRPARPADQSIEEADRYYTKEQRRRAIISAIGLLGSSVGPMAYAGSPRIQGALDRWAGTFGNK